MPTSMVLHIKVRERCSGKEINGTVVRELLAEALAKYARQSHNTAAPEIVRNYCFSPMYLGERAMRPLPMETKEGTICWFRVSTLDGQYSDNISNCLYQEAISGLLTYKPSPVGKLEIMRVICQASNKYPWVNSINIDQLLQNAETDECEALIEFVSPTVIVNGGVLTPLPIPQIIYNYLAKCWNKIVPNQAIPDFEISEMINKVTIVEFKNLSTVIHPIANGKLRVGFTGLVRFRFIGKDPNLLRHFNLLSDTIYYSGIGQDTHVGCGMARRIPRNKWTTLRSMVR